MDFYSFGPIAAILDFAYATVTWISTLLEPLAGTANAALAVVVLTVFVRTLLIPVGISQVRADVARRRLAPQLAELRRRYRSNPTLLQRKTMELYAAEKVSPLAGCLPLLLQAPVLSTVYALFILTTINAHANELLTHGLFGVPLGSGLVNVVMTGTLTWTSGALFAALIVVIAVVAQTSRRLLLQPAAIVPQPPPAGGVNLAGLTRALSFAPFLTAATAAFVPLAAAIYLVVTVTWTLVERLVLRRLFRAGPVR